MLPNYGLSCFARMYPKSEKKRVSFVVMGYVTVRVGLGVVVRVSAAPPT